MGDCDGGAPKGALQKGGERLMLTALVVASFILVPPVVYVWRSYEEPKE